MDSGCSNSTAFTAACSEGLCVEGICITTGGRCDQTTSKLSAVKVKRAAAVAHCCPPTPAAVAQMHSSAADLLLQVEKSTMTEGLFPEPARVRPKERGGRWGHASPFMRGSTIVRSQTFSPGARSQYVCRVSFSKRMKR